MGDLSHDDHALSQDFAIHPKKTADALLHDYWIGAHPLQPFLHKGTFMKRFVFLSCTAPGTFLMKRAIELMHRLEQL